MITDIILTSNLIIGIFCLLTSCFLLVNAINSKKMILYPFFIYFLFVSISIFLILVYAINPQIDRSLGLILILFSIIITFIGDMSLLVMTFYINKKLTKNKILIEIIISLLVLLVLFLSYPSNITNFTNQEPNLSILLASLLFLTYFVPNLFCIINILGADDTSSVFRGKYNRNLIAFFVLGIILTFSKITGFFTIDINNFSFNFNFMEILGFLFVIQIFIIVYTIPRNKKRDFTLNFQTN